MSRKIVIIGSGPGGYIGAIRSAQMGAEVTVVERDKIGGTCLNWGCIPSKVMIHTAELLTSLENPKSLGLQTNGPVTPDIRALMDRKRAVIEVQAEGIRKLLNHHNIRFLHGTAMINGAGGITVRPPEGDALDLPWDRLILAPGSRPLQIPSIPFDDRSVLSSNDALRLAQVPESVLIVGGGVIGCEFAFVLQALGAKVTVVEAMDRLLPIPTVDEDCSKTLQREMKKKKIGCLLQQTVQGVKHRGDTLRVAICSSELSSQTGHAKEKPQSVDVEKILVCVGRTPNTEALGLETVGVETDARGWIPVTDRMATKNPHIYAIGDVLGPSRTMLAHVATAEGAVAAENAMGGDAIMDYSVVPNAIFTIPEIATVGVTEQQAQRKKIPYRTETVLFRNLGKAQVLGKIAGQAKIIFHETNGKILGVHMVGPRVTDLIAEGALALRSGCTVKDLAETIHAHPTLAEIMQEGAHKCLGKPLHG